MDIIFYDSNKKVIDGYKSVSEIPKVNEHITFDSKKEYIVMLVMHDYNEQNVHVMLRPASKNDVTFMHI